MSEASKSQSFLFLSFLWEYLRASAFELWDTSCGTILEVDTILQFDYNSPSERQPLTTTSISALNRIRVRQQKTQRLNTAAIAQLKQEPQW
jgi:hypothetical protein